MITIIDGRETGKTKKLLETAKEKDAIILTQDKRAFEVKAKSYGYSNITILDYEDLENDNYDLNRPLMIHNGDKLLYYLMDRYYGLSVVGFTATQED